MKFYLVRSAQVRITGSLNLMFSLYLVVAYLLGDLPYQSWYDGLIVNLSIFVGLALIVIIDRKKTIEHLEDINIKEAILLVASTWCVMVVIGAIPYILDGVRVADAIFESASGFSTTGSTIFTDVEGLSKSLLLWRASTQWVGGMGIILFFVSILSSLKKAGAMLFRSEMPGPVKESMTPHVRDTTRVLWGMYMGLTIILIIILVFLKMPLFEAVVHAFTTLSTGGFSTNNTSVMEYSPAIQWWLTLFMLFGGLNFSLYILLFTSQRKLVFKDVEVKWYIGFIVILSVSVASVLYFHNERDLGDSLRIGFFTITSLVTTTGHANFNYELLPMGIQGILLITLFTGGSAGSTSGGIKFYRIVLIYKAISYEIKKSISPNLVTSMRIAGETLPMNMIHRAFVFVTIYMATAGIGMVIFIATGLDFITAFTAAATTLGNVGPGLGSIGPSENFAHLNDFAKYVAATLMILGRLEFFTLISLFHLEFWRDN